MAEKLTESMIENMLKLYTSMSNRRTTEAAEGVAELYTKDAVITFGPDEEDWCGRHMVRRKLREEFTDPENKAPTVTTGQIEIADDGQSAFVSERFVSKGKAGKVHMHIYLVDGKPLIRSESIIMSK